MVVSRSLRCCWKAKRNAVAARLLLSSKRELRFREQQVLAVPLCGARYGWRDIEGRTENKVATSALHTPRKLAIAYYIIHEWRSFRRADRRPTRFFAIRRDCEKQKRQRKPGGGAGEEEEEGEGGELFEQTYYRPDVTVATTSVVVVTHSPERISLMSFVKGLLMRADVLAPFKNVSWFIRAAGKIR